MQHSKKLHHQFEPRRKTSISLKWLSHVWWEGDFGAFGIFSQIEWSSSATYSTVENSPHSFWSWSENYSCFASKQLNHDSEPWLYKLTLEIQALLGEALGKHWAGWDGIGKVCLTFSMCAVFIPWELQCGDAFPALQHLSWWSGGHCFHPQSRRWWAHSDHHSAPAKRVTHSWCYVLREQNKVMPWGGVVGQIGLVLRLAVSMLAAVNIKPQV